MQKVEVRKTHLGVSDVNGCRCLVNRFPEAKGDNLFLFTLDAKVNFKDL